MRARRILYVITDLEVGGVPLHLLRLATGVQRAGYDARVISLAPPGPVAGRLQSAGIDVDSCQASGRADWRVIDRLTAFITDLRPDLIHALLFHANVACRLACLLSGFPPGRLICEIQTVEIERRWHLLVDHLSYPLCRFTIGNSPSVVRHLHQRAGIPCRRLRLVRGGIDVEGIRSAVPLARPLLGAGPDDVLLLWVGRMDSVKGLDVLLEAVAALRRSTPLKLLLAGDGADRPRLEAQTARLALERNVTFLGRRDDVDRLLRTVDLFVFPSRTEGLPHAVLEAMAASVPVVATDVPGCHDVVTDGLTGRLVPPDDPAALAGAITEALADDERSRRMSDKACHMVARDYTLHRCRDRYLDLYESVSGGAGSV